MSLRTFCLRLFQHCPLLASFSVENHTKAFEEFLQYKTRVPVRGAILLNHAMDSVVLVKGWKKGANWSFPRGKINKDEDDLDCAVREVYEETGFDLSAAGLVPTDSKPKYIEIAMREQQLRLYVFRDVPMDTNFQPRTRKEISKIQWYKLSELPTFRKKNAQNNQNDAASQNNNKFYMVAPFLVPLKKWVTSQKKMEEKRTASGHYNYLQAQMSVDDTYTEDDTWAPGREDTRSKVPALDTLDGATRELQRLLKMQPPTQGVQPPAPQATQQDKGSALLSILQANSQKSAVPAAPQPPMEQMYAQGQFPPNPNYQGNQQAGNPNMYGQQGIPMFPGPHGQQPPMGYEQQAQQNHQVQQQQHQLHQQQQQIHHQQQQLHQQQQRQRQHEESNVPLAHPQPLAPQVQPGVFNTGALAAAQQQQNNAPAASKQLSGQSMALLNAFKRDTSHQPSVNHLQPPPPQQAPRAQHQQPPQQYPQHHQQQQHQPQPQQPQPQAQQSQYPQHPQHAGGAPSIGSGSGGGRPAPDQHRTALLDMFKKPSVSPAQAAANSYPAQAAPPQQPPQPNPQDLAFHKLSIQQSQPGPQQPQYQQQPPPQHQQQQPQYQPQPTQILSRGQNPQAFPGQQYVGAAQPAQPAQNGQSGPPGDQKRQLLSLFGQKQAPPSGAIIHEIAAGTPDPQNVRTRVSSLTEDASRRGSETPISPADETFLLGYLQSVTNSAQR